MRGDRRRRGEPGPDGGDRARRGRRRDHRSAGEGDADERGRGRRRRRGPPFPARGHPPARGIRARRARRVPRPGGDRRRLPRPAVRVPRRGPLRPRDVAGHGADDRGAGIRLAIVQRGPGDLRAGGGVPRGRRLPGDPADGGRRAVPTDAPGGKDGPASAARGTSGRRWEAWGPLRAVLFMSCLRIGYLLGRTPSRCAEAYRRGPALRRREPAPPMSSAGE